MPFYDDPVNERPERKKKPYSLFEGGPWRWSQESGQLSEMGFSGILSCGCIGRNMH